VERSAVVVLAAGRGTRFGGMKQLAEVGPRGEAIIDILLRRAADVGIERAVVVVAPDGRGPMAGHLEVTRPDLPVELAVQSRPRGTADAVLAARDAVDGPFVVVNADDVYPRDAFALLAAHQRDAPPSEHAMVAFRVAHTLTGDRPGWRALIDADEHDALRAVREGRVVQHGTALMFEAGDDARELRGDEFVSMNIWSFRTSVFDAIAAASADHTTDAELYLPDVVAAMVDAGSIVRVLRSEATCIGLTYREDVAAVRRAVS
jgi:bifunctional N-acetylglucosamine-1-phosphate-uridyltransferase/glucosamine-1-phosphate-acetyltransferase GlmU-like protein